MLLNCENLSDNKALFGYEKAIVCLYKYFSTSCLKPHDLIFHLNYYHVTNTGFSRALRIHQAGDSGGYLKK